MATPCIAQVTFKFEPKGKPLVAAFDTRTPAPMVGRSCSRIDTQWG